MVRDSLRSLVVDSGIFGLKLGILVVFENMRVTRRYLVFMSLGWFITNELLRRSVLEAC